MKYITPILLTVDFIMNVFFIISLFYYFYKVYHIIYIAFYQSPNMDIQNRTSFLSTTVQSPTVDLVHFNSTRQ